MFKFITDTAEAAVNVVADTADLLTGGDGTPTRKDVAQLLAAGMTVGAIAVAFDVSEDLIRDLAE